MLSILASLVRDRPRGLLRGEGLKPRCDMWCITAVGKKIAPRQPFLVCRVRVLYVLACHGFTLLLPLPLPLYQYLQPYIHIVYHFPLFVLAAYLASLPIYLPFYVV